MQPKKSSPVSVSCTEWFSCTTPPVRSGVYQRAWKDDPDYAIFSYFDVKTGRWYLGFTDWSQLGSRTPEQDAAENAFLPIANTANYIWRGVAR